MFLLSVTFFGFLPQADTTSKKTKMEPSKDTPWLTYVEPEEYSVQYPSSWKFWRYQGSGKGLDFNFVELKKHDHNPCNNETCAMCPNSAGVSLSVRPKESKSLEEFANRSKQYYEVWEWREEKLEMAGRPAIKLYMIVDGYSTVHLLIDCGDSLYASLYASRSGGEDSTRTKNEIDQIFSSFKILK
jgi:hypothetical protein